MGASLHLFVQRLDLVAFFIEELIFEEAEALIRSDTDTSSNLQLPTTSDGDEEPFGEVGCYIRMYMYIYRRDLVAGLGLLAFLPVDR